MSEYCSFCDGQVPTKRHPNDRKLLCCRLCGNGVKRAGHPAEAA